MLLTARVLSAGNGFCNKPLIILPSKHIQSCIVWSVIAIDIIGDYAAVKVYCVTASLKLTSTCLRKSCLRQAGAN